MKKYEITYTSMRKIVVELKNYESAEFLAEKQKQEGEEILMISSEKI